MLGVAVGLSSPSSTTVTQAHGLTGFQPNASDNQETKFAVGAESFHESKGAMNCCTGFQPSVDTGFQPKEHSPFEPAAPKKKRKYEPTAFKSIPHGVAGRPEKLPSVSEAFALLFGGDKVVAEHPLPQRGVRRKRTEPRTPVRASSQVLTVASSQRSTVQSSKHQEAKRWLAGQGAALHIDGTEHHQEAKRCRKSTKRHQRAKRYSAGQWNGTERHRR